LETVWFERCGGIEEGGQWRIFRETVWFERCGEIEEGGQWWRIFGERESRSECVV